MITSISHYRCKCGVRVDVLTETDKARIEDVMLLEVVCPKCAERQSIYGHCIIKIGIEPADQEDRVP